MVVPAVVTALLVVLIAALVALGPFAALVLIPAYVVYRRMHPDRPLPRIKIYRGRFWRVR